MKIPVGRDSPLARGGGAVAGGDCSAFALPSPDRSQGIGYDGATHAYARGARKRSQPLPPQINALLAKYPDLSAVRVLEEVARGEDGYRGSVYPVRRYLGKIRPARGRVYQEVLYGQARPCRWIGATADD